MPLKKPIGHGQARRGHLNADRAAARVGMRKPQFLAAVRNGTMPAPVTKLGPVPIWEATVIDAHVRAEFKKRQAGLSTVPKRKAEPRKLRQRVEQALSERNHASKESHLDTAGTPA